MAWMTSPRELGFKIKILTGDQKGIRLECLVAPAVHKTRQPRRMKSRLPRSGLLSKRKPFGQPRRKPSIENFFLGGSDVVFQPAQLDETLIGVIHNVGCLGIVIAWLSDCANVDEILFARFDLELGVGAAADHTIADKGYRHMRVAEETNGGVLIRKTGGCREFVKNVAPSLRTIQSGVDYREISDHPHILQVPQPLLVLGRKLLTRPVHSLGGCG